ncbi:MAG: UvrD-helicase domain-containing protein [Candidatus Doudnabacteria bacterium]|nr:UvrD-helicase domain-containing protein [Candidatus Doudnabacteria bacterium]
MRKTTTQLDQTDQTGLNPAQLEAVKAPMGPVLVLAGAGSGKTRCLTIRIVYLIHKLKIRPEEILAVTFTNKAAGEMKTRVAKLLGQRSGLRPMMGTFHSIGVKILRQEREKVGLTSNFVIFDDNDQESLLKEILSKLKIDPTKLKPALFQRIIDRAKNNLEEPEDIDDNDNYDRKFKDTARLVYQEYQDQLLKHNAVDFGDLIMMPVKIFQNHPETLSKYQEQWKYILVDEYQDTNHAQYVFTKLLASKYKNLFVVGDDAQAIYGFRGANLQNILDFEKDYPKAQIIRLEQNYRSTSPILAVAQKVIELNPRQHQKKLWTENREGNIPTLFRADDEMAEAWFVAKQIIDHQDGPSNELQYVPDEDTDILSRIMRHSRMKILPKLRNRKGLNNVAVLYRTHAQSRALEEIMIESSIPYQIVGGLKFYERKEIKDVLAYLRLLVNTNDLISLKRVINLPPRGVGPKTFELLKDALLEKKEKKLAEVFEARPQIRSFFEILDSIGNIEEEATILDIIKSVLKFTGYESFLRDGTEEGESRFENIQELFNVAASFSKLPWKEGIGRFLEEVALMTNIDELDENSDKVTLMTLHQAKGLEFDIVFLVGLEEGLLPHSRSMIEANDVAEEIRLAYVGVTRAKKQLYLVYAMSRKQFGTRNLSVPSRILKAIPEELYEVYESEF